MNIISQFNCEKQLEFSFHIQQIWKHLILATHQSFFCICTTFILFFFSLGVLVYPADIQNHPNRMAIGMCFMILFSVALFFFILTGCINVYCIIKKVGDYSYLKKEWSEQKIKLLKETEQRIIFKQSKNKLSIKIPQKPVKKNIL